MKKIGIEKGMSDVENYLKNEGYSVQVVDEETRKNPSSLDKFDAVVTTGLNTNAAGYFDTSTKVPMINADGLTPEEIKSAIEGNALR